MSQPFGIVIHGGAGTILRENLTPELETEYNQKLLESLTAGYEILENGSSSIEAVQSAIVVMENSELFNAGKGAVFTHDETNEQDASIMCGKTLECGAVASVRHVKNPIKLARTVMDKSEHILLGGAGAEQFAKQHDLDFADKDYFYTERRWQQLETAKKQQRTQLDHTPEEKCGTVGAVALDKDGNLSAATSSGGMTNKKHGRIGDSAMIGAGTYANNNSCAVSTTGHGEFFMRNVSAYDVHAMMTYSQLSVDKSAIAVVDKIYELGGFGGLIAIDQKGNISLPMNSPGMYRGWKLSNSEFETRIYND